jgi:BMFP domain-containing protein YqiC
MTDKRIFDDLAELASGAVGVFANLREQLAADARDKVDHLTKRLDLPTRAEFDRLQGMVTKLRQVQDELVKRLDKMDGKKPTPAKPAPKKTPPKKK